MTTGITWAGTSGDDTKVGSDGDDALYGGTGDDTLTGSAGDDTLYGGEGDDFLFSRDEDDTFVFRAGDGDDIIGWFQNGDIIKFDGVPGVSEFSDLTVEESDVTNSDGEKTGAKVVIT